jgi:ATP-binding cassette, subfamily G (WHITE), member 2, PDR
VRPLTTRRNFGILIAYIIFFTAAYILAAEYLSLTPSKGEVLLFRSETIRANNSRKSTKQDEETGVIQVQDRQPKSTNSSPGSTQVGGHSSVFYWSKVCYDITIKGNPRRILDNVDGWVKPGTLTALMVSIFSRLLLFCVRELMRVRVPLVLEKRLYLMCLLIVLPWVL